MVSWWRKLVRRWPVRSGTGTVPGWLRTYGDGALLWMDRTAGCTATVVLLTRGLALPFGRAIGRRKSSRVPVAPEVMDGSHQRRNIEVASDDLLPPRLARLLLGGIVLARPRPTARRHHDAGDQMPLYVRRRGAHPKFGHSIKSSYSAEWAFAAGLDTDVGSSKA